MKLKLVMLSLVTIFLAGCDVLDGQLTVTKAFLVNGNSGRQAIAAGIYKTGLDFKRDRVIADIETGGAGTKVSFAVPTQSTIPENGNFELRSAQTGQPLDVLGSVKTVKTQSEVYRGYENCQTQNTTPNCGPNGCINQPGQQWGRQYVEYYYRDTDKTIHFAMTEVGAAHKKYAQFDGSAKTSQKVIIRQDQCF